jgi:hypothetical protein
MQNKFAQEIGAPVDLVMPDRLACSAYTLFEWDPSWRTALQG